MSNEYKEWVIDKICDVIFENHLMDEIDEVYNSTYKIADKLVEGKLEGKRKVYHIWLDDDGNWKYENDKIIF